MVADHISDRLLAPTKLEETRGTKIFKRGFKKAVEILVKRPGLYLLAGDERKVVS